MDTVTHGNHVEQACYMPTNTFTRCSHCFELKRSETSLLHGNGHRFAWFALFRAELKMEQACCMRLDSVTRGSHCLHSNKLVRREWTWFPIVRTVWSSNVLEQACCIAMDTVMWGS